MAVASVPLLILYDDDRVAKPDAMVLAGDKRRLPIALELVAAGDRSGVGNARCIGRRGAVLR